MNTVLFLTACINPNGMTQTRLQDADERLRQYVTALQWYLFHTNLQIVFVENTGYDISDQFKQYIDAGRLEVLTFNGNSYNKSLGKGYGEALIIMHGLENSRWLKNADHIIKITGRLICKNINRICCSYKHLDTIYAIKRKGPFGQMECQSQVMVVTKEFLNNYFLTGIEKLNDSKFYWFEHLLYDSIKDWVKDGHHYRYMWIPVKLEGQSGSTGNPINTYSGKSVLGFYLHYLLHFIGYYGKLKFWEKDEK